MKRSSIQWKMASLHLSTLLVCNAHTYTHTAQLYYINSSLQIAALENNATADNVNKGEEKEEGFTLDTQDSSNTTKTTPTDGKPTETKPTEAEPTDSPVKDKMVRNELLHAKLRTHSLK